MTRLNLSPGNIYSIVALPLKIIVGDRIGGKLDENFLLAPDQNKGRVFYRSPQHFLRERKFPALKKEIGSYNLPYISRQRKINI
jgi:hypothetical protein